MELESEHRTEVISTILGLLPEGERGKYQEGIAKLTKSFEGQDANTLGVLYRAAEKDRFEEFYNKLEEYYEKEGQHVSVERRGAARNVNSIVLEDIVKKETEIANKERDPKDRTYWPKKVQILAKNLGSVKMELFFLNCYREIMGPQNQ